MLKVRNLSKKYGSKQVLDNISVTFERGNVYGIVGENGAGKTTFLRCVAGLEEYDGDIQSLYKSIKNHLGYLETNPVMMSYMTGWEYLKLLCISKNIKNEDFEEQNVFDLPLGEYAETYSTGMKKKLALMGVLLRKNDIIILDEPFNGVDIQSNILITDIIVRLKSLNKIVLITSHIFSTLSDSCDEIILLANGRIDHKVKRDAFAALESRMKENILNESKKEIILE